MCRIRMRVFWNFPTPLVRPFNPTVSVNLTDIVVGFSLRVSVRRNHISVDPWGWEGAEKGRYEAADAAPPVHERPFICAWVFVLRWWYPFGGRGEASEPTPRPRSSRSQIFDCPSVYACSGPNGRERSGAEKILCTRIDCVVVCVRERADKWSIHQLNHAN